MANIAVIGAGISGLACARRLVEAGQTVRVIEKSRSFGGRCASRLWEGAVIDSGVQYFKMHDPGFEREMRRICGDDLLQLESPIRDRSGQVISDDEPRWFHRTGNNRIGRALAEGLDVRREVAVAGIRVVDDVVHVDGEAFDAVVSCAPWPQTAAMLGLPEGEEAIYERCLTAAFSYAGSPSGFAAQTYAVLDTGGSPLAWVACENHKPGRVPDGMTVLIAQTGGSFSAEHFDETAPDWTARIQSELEEMWQLDRADFQAVFAHRWKFSRRVTPAPGVSLPPRVFLCGDSVVDSKLEAVWLSGTQTAEHVMQFC